MFALFLALREFQYKYAAYDFISISNYVQVVFCIMKEPYDEISENQIVCRKEMECFKNNGKLREIFTKKKYEHFL